MGSTPAIDLAQGTRAPAEYPEIPPVGPRYWANGTVGSKLVQDHRANPHICVGDVLGLAGLLETGSAAFKTNSTYMAHFWVTTDPVLLDYFFALNSTPTRKVLVNKTHGLRCLAEPFTHLLHPIPTEQFTSLK